MKRRESGKEFSEKKLLAFLQNPRSYPHRPRTVRMLQTHASLVFLAAPFAFKVKKAVNFGFLDFSTIEKRRHYCEREIALNRRLSQEVYLEVVPISFRNGRFHFGTGGEMVEYAVKMRKLAPRFFLNHLLAANKVGRREIDRVIEVLAAFYKSQRPAPEIEIWGRLDRLKISTDENFRQLEPFLGKTISHAAHSAIREFTDGFYNGHAALIHSRLEQGWIRDCHGDLHLEHIHLTPRALHIYDCIEFNDRLRYVDVANDVAFLAMDLDFNGRPDLAGHLVSPMEAALEDDSMTRLMDFYKCYRAVVRGKVESLASQEREIPGQDREASFRKARQYFRLALQYAIAGSRPTALIITGRIASGKSALARTLSRELGWAALSSDRLRKKLAGVPLLKRGTAAARAKLYSERMTQKTYATLLDNAARMLQAGQNVILDATFGHRSLREEVVDRLAGVGAQWCFIEAHAPDELVKARLKARSNERGEISDARLEDFDALSGRYEPAVELDAAHVLNVATARPPETILSETLCELARRQMKISGNSNAAAAR